MKKVLAGTALLLGTAGALAAPLSFGSASATYEQMVPSGPWAASLAIDGLFPSSPTWPAGWAIFENDGTTGTQLALFTLAAPLAAGSWTLTYTLNQTFGDRHLLDTFQLGYTTAAGPNLGSAFTPVSVTSATALSGMAFDLSAGSGNVNAMPGAVPNTDIYTITAMLTAGAPVTGLFLRAIDNVGAGPGLQPNGNFVLTEFQVSAVPEPGTYALALAGLTLLGFVARRRTRR